MAKDHRDANYYSLLIVVLLERGEPVTLREAAQRFEEAGVAPAAQALASLQRCKPGATHGRGHSWLMSNGIRTAGGRGWSMTTAA